MSIGIQVWSGTAASNAAADSAVNWAEGQAPSSVNDSARAMMASVAKWRDDNNGTLVTTGSTVAYTITTNQVQAALTDGYMVTARFHATVDTSATFAPDGLTAKPIQTRSGIVVGFGQIRSGSIRKLTYSSTATAWLMHENPNVEPGKVHYAAYASAGSDELLCDGSIYSRTTYADLFAAIGTVFGSSDSSTFKVPDITGRVIVAKEASATRLTSAVSGINGGTLGAAGGDQASQSHTHTAAVTDTGHIHNAHINAGTASVNQAGSGGEQAVANNSGNYMNGSFASSVGSVDSAVTGISVANSTTGTGSSQNVQPAIVLNAFIKI